MCIRDRDHTVQIPIIASSSELISGLSARPELSGDGSFVEAEVRGDINRLHLRIPAGVVERNDFSGKIHLVRDDGSLADSVYIHVRGVREASVFPQLLRFHRTDTDKTVFANAVLSLPGADSPQKAVVRASVGGKQIKVVARRLGGTSLKLKLNAPREPIDSNKEVQFLIQCKDKSYKIIVPFRFMN